MATCNIVAGGDKKILEQLSKPTLRMVTVRPSGHQA